MAPGDVLVVVPELLDDGPVGVPVYGVARGARDGRGVVDEFTCTEMVGAYVMPRIPMALHNMMDILW